jgi:hypothetical protein
MVKSTIASSTESRSEFESVRPVGYWKSRDESSVRTADGQL